MLPGSVPRGVARPFNLVEPGDGVADMSGVAERLLALVWEGELAFREPVLLGRARPLVRLRHLLAVGPLTPHLVGPLDVLAYRLLGVTAGTFMPDYYWYPLGPQAIRKTVCGSLFSGRPLYRGTPEQPAGLGVTSDPDEVVDGARV
jgi:hypothetical protein